MAIQETVNELGQQEWLDPVSEAVQQAVANAVSAAGPAGRTIDNALNGTWLGHPLHPVLVEVPVGTWTAALFFDGLNLFSRKNVFAPAADGSIAIGIVGALVSALSGLAQWEYTVGSARRKGMLHALLNTTALSLYTVSLSQRLRGKRAAGVFTGLFGYGITLASAYIGGDLVYGERIGVDHAPEETPPSEWVPVLANVELPEGGMRRVRAGAVDVMLARQNGVVYALAESCSHMGGPLSEGTLEPEGCVTCPWHGSQFALDDGHVVNGPATYDQPHYEARVRDGRIEIRG